MKKIHNNIIWGVCMVALGVILLGNYLSIFSFNLFFDGWWTLFLIIPGLSGLFSNRNKTMSVIFLIVGIIFLLSAQGVIQNDLILKIVLASVIIVFGISIIFNNSKASKNHPYVENKDGLQNYVAVFSGQKEKYYNEKFQGANLTAVFGGIEIDLRDAVIDKDIQINATLLFGGCKLFVPQNVNVKVFGANIFGGTENAVGIINAEFPTIYITSTTLFGGIEIK